MVTAGRAAAVAAAVTIFVAFHLFVAYVVMILLFHHAFCDIAEDECDLTWTAARVIRWVLAVGAGFAVYALLLYALFYARELRPARPFLVSLAVALALCGALALHLRAFPL